MDSTLVVCYSYTGNAYRLAQLICAQQGWPLGQVVERTPRSGPSGTFNCVLDSLFHRHPRIRYQGPDPADFHTVVLVAPIWIYQLAGPMRSFVELHREQLRHVAVVTTMGARGGSNAVAEIGRILGVDPILSATVTAREVEDGSCAQAMQAFGAALRPGRASEPVREAVWSPTAG
jgi:hypothetical protein